MPTAAKRPASHSSSSSSSSSDTTRFKKQKLPTSTKGKAGDQVIHTIYLSPDSSSSAEDQEVAVPAKNGKGRQPPIETLFERYTLKPDPLPKFNQAWGTTPMPGPDGPKSYPDQPPARTSNAQTIPPLWEDRKFRFQKGARFVKTFRRGEQIPEDAPANLDQQDNLILRLIDMRPKSRKDPTPRRMPTYYMYQNGQPKNWNNRQVVKALNDRRQQAIDRITMDPPWTDFEREYLADILIDYPNASIKEITERFNWRFKGQDFAKPTAFVWDYLSVGRTIESIRHEYLISKHKYDVGEVPKRKELADRSVAGKAAGPVGMHVFGKRDKAFDHDCDDDDSDAEGDAKPQGNKKPQPVTCTRIEEVSDEDDDSTPLLSRPALAFVQTERPPLSEDDAELLDLAGYNDLQVRFSFNDSSIFGSLASYGSEEIEQFEDKSQAHEAAIARVTETESRANAVE
jgi:hypothetical protein